MSSERGEPAGAALALAAVSIATDLPRKRRDGRPLPITSELSEAPKRATSRPADRVRGPGCAGYNHELHDGRG